MPWPRAFRPVHSLINPVALTVAGRCGSLVDLEHVGRNSGAIRHTPLRAFRSGNHVVVGANFGRESQWVRNVMAGCHARMRMRGQTLLLSNPQLVDLSDAAGMIPPWFAMALRYVVRTQHCVVFDVLDSASVPLPGAQP